MENINRIISLILGIVFIVVLFVVINMNRSKTTIKTQTSATPTIATQQQQPISQGGTLLGNIMSKFGFGNKTTPTVTPTPTRIVNTTINTINEDIPVYTTEQMDIAIQTGISPTPINKQLSSAQNIPNTGPSIFFTLGIAAFSALGYSLKRFR